MSTKFDDTAAGSVERAAYLDALVRAARAVVSDVNGYAATTFSGPEERQRIEARSAALQAALEPFMTWRGEVAL
jgi:hypothetical protein